MPIQDPHSLVKRQEGGHVAYKAVPFDEPQPTAPARKPPVLQQLDRKDFPSNSQYQRAATAAQKQYEAENTAYQAEKGQHDKAMEGWLARKAAWDAKEEGKVNQSGAGQQRLTDYLKSPEGRQQLEFNNQMMTYPFLPAALVATQIGKGMRGPFSKVGYGLLEAGAGEGLSALERQNQPKPYEDPAGHYQNQAYQNFLTSTGLGAGVGSIRAALLKDKNAPAPAPKAPEPTSPQVPPVEPYKGNPRDVARYIAHDLGLTPASKESKADTITNALGQIKSGNATPEQIELVTQRARGIAPETILGRIAKSNKPLAALLATAGLGAAATIGAPSEAKAATPKEPLAKTQPETSSDLSDLEREYGTGLPRGAVREAAKSAADAGSYMVPGVGEARMAAETPSLYKPSDEDLADAEYWQRGREEMSRPKAANQPSQASSVNPEQHAFNPEHLPEHERGHIENPQEAHNKAVWMYPYLRAGSEAVKRGEDFFGGSPEYENQLAALKHFYHGQQAPTAPEAPIEEEAPVGHKHGGSVHKKGTAISKQINSIHDTFKLKLEDKERMIASLEKAVARKPNAKLSKRIAKEKSEVERIKAHLETVRSHAQ